MHDSCDRVRANLQEQALEQCKVEPFIFEGEGQMAFEAGIASTIDWYLQNRAWCDAITSGNYQRQRLGLDTL